jgi:GT2 family glycosyltransferase
MPKATTSRRAPVVRKLREPTEIGYIDSFLDGLLKGWAGSLVNPDSPVSVFIFIDGEPVDNFICEIDRPDVLAAGFPSARVGFSYRIPPRFRDNEAHTLSLRFSSGYGALVFSDLGPKAEEAGFVLSPRPPLIDGVVDEVSHGAIHGWVLQVDQDTGKRSGGMQILITCNGVTLGQVKAERLRPDVGRVFDCDPYCGFSFVPPLAYRGSKPFEFHFTVMPANVALNNSPFLVEFPNQYTQTKIAEMTLQIEQMSTQLWEMKRRLRSLLPQESFSLSEYDAWARKYYSALRLRVGRERQLRRADPSRPPDPLVSVLCPAYRPRMSDFVAAVESVLRQTYSNWELIIVDDRSDSPELAAVIAGFAERDPRIRSLKHRKNGGISVATNTAIAAAKGAYIALFDHDDMLVDVALEVMVAQALSTGARMLYSDEDKIDDYGRFSEPNLKSDFNYRLLLAQNYVCHFLMVEQATLREVGPLRSVYDGAQDHDLVLRLTETIPPADIRHVRELLYHWRKTPGSTASQISVKPYAVNAGISCVRDHLARRGQDCEITSTLGITHYDIAWKFPQTPEVSIIIPFRDRAELTRLCLGLLLQNTDYPNYNVVLVDNQSVTEEAAAFVASAAQEGKVRFIRVDEPFNYSRLNNAATSGNDAEFFLFLNNDVFMTQPGWLRILVDEALADPQVGIVSGKLLYPNGTVQHGGVILGVDGVAAHSFSGLVPHDPGFMGRAICAQDLSAVSAACMLARAEMFREVGGFDEEDLAVAYNDIDLCLKFRALGYRVIWTPAMTAEHHESLSRGSDMEASNLPRFVYEYELMTTRWEKELANDPFCNPHFGKTGGPFQTLSSRSLEYLPRGTLPGKAG